MVPEDPASSDRVTGRVPVDRGDQLTQPVTSASGSSSPDRDGLIEDLADLLADLGAGSLFHLRTALQARQVEGVTGSLEIHIPRKGRDHVDVTWRGGV